MPTGPSQPDPARRGTTRGGGAAPSAHGRPITSPEHTRTLIDPFASGHVTGGPHGLTNPAPLTEPLGPGHSTGHATGHGTRSGRTGGLRLVRTELSPEIASRYSKPVRAKLASEVGVENRRAAGLSHHDARRIMAQRVAEHIEGGRAGILAPERRRALVSTAQRLGIRTFDANLIIAVVQDRFRRGLLGPSAAGTDERLELLGDPGSLDPRSLDPTAPIAHPALAARRRERFWQAVRLLLASAAIAGILMVWLVNWLTGRLP